MENMRFQLIACSCFIFYSITTQAMTLSIDTGSYWCPDEIAPGFGCGDISTAFTGFNGIVIGETQLASGSHSGYPDGSEMPNIDQPWLFFGNTGMHLTTSPITIISQSSGTMLLDFSGWAWSWNGIETPLGAGSWLANPDGVAVVSCSLDCGDGDTYSLLYSARIPPGDPSLFGNIGYKVFLEGVISTVPVPSAIWLMLSGLIGLAGFNRISFMGRL